MSTLLTNISAVLVDGRALLIEGEPGSGKSSLALALIDRGASLIGDDGVSVDPRDGALWISPPPNASGLLEIRNVGLVEIPVSEGPAALVIRLDKDAPRYVEKPQIRHISGIAIGQISLFPDTPALALRAEWALKKHAP